jgi:hypothetical protein
MARLLWEHEGQVIKDYPFPKGSVTIGRRKENTIVFNNPEVSSSHARIDKVGTDCILTDLQSTNGTFVNNLKVLSHRLSHGDRISIGKNVLLFIGTEKAKADAERANIPLDRTVIIGGAKRRKKAPTPAVQVEKHYIESAPTRNYMRALVFGLLIVGALVVVGVFTVKDKAFLLRGIIPKALQGQRTGGTTVPPSAQGGKTTQEGDISSPPGSEGTESPAVSEENLDAGDTERSPFNIEAIVWSSDAKNSFVLINGVEYRLGESIEGKTIARIERDHVVIQSQEGESIVRLKFK